MPDLKVQNDPYDLFADWHKQACEMEAHDPGAMALATWGANGFPDNRMVLFKGINAGQLFTFYTNSNSEKGQQLAINPGAALCFYWKTTRRQIRLRGGIKQLSTAEADGYFSTRPRGSQIGAHASAQSKMLISREELEQSVADLTKEFAGKKVPRPPNWRGYGLFPLQIEFWQNREDRLHDRLRYERNSESERWRHHYLYP